MKAERSALGRAGAQVLRGFAMGAVDVVPGVSGGTVALVLGIYERLVEVIRSGARALGSLVTGDWRGFWRRVKGIDWLFLIPLLAGIMVAVISLASVIETQLRTNPAEMAGLFAGLVGGSIVVAARMIRAPRRIDPVIAAAVAAVVFAGLGLRAGPVADPSVLVFAGAGMVGVCAMILPGISGSFLLLMMGMYGPVIAAIDERRYASAAALALGAAVGLALFSSLLGRLLERAHDRVMAVLVGLMIGSMRVLWPWPNGVGVIDDHPEEPATGAELAWPAADEWLGPTLLAAAGFAVVMAWSRWATRTERSGQGGGDL